MNLQTTCTGKIIYILMALTLILFNIDNLWPYLITPVIRRELDEYVDMWNSHPIRPTSGAYCPSGRPEDLYDMPQPCGKLSESQALPTKIL